MDSEEVTIGAGLIDEISTELSTEEALPGVGLDIEVGVTALLLPRREQDQAETEGNEEFVDLEEEIPTESTEEDMVAEAELGRGMGEGEA